MRGKSFTHPPPACFISRGETSFSQDMKWAKLCLHCGRLVMLGSDTDNVELPRCLRFTDNGMEWNGMEWNGIEEGRRGVERRGEERRGEERRGEEET
ncbi:hypothetical protein llap_9211 [Limosa lapponica baueri]|uniref:Uncharacterized protein n=1 Tax=Limosa lapponica baueri TaxID=1758121 RepID=A0A2I0U386_LIMLA|nr:hypothetical protein llap_9211 [Limosa lapponica baueri]